MLCACRIPYGRTLFFWRTHFLPEKKLELLRATDKLRSCFVFFSDIFFCRPSPSWVENVSHVFGTISLGLVTRLLKGLRQGLLGLTAT